MRSEAFLFPGIFSDFFARLGRVYEATAAEIHLSRDHGALRCALCTLRRYDRICEAWTEAIHYQQHPRLGAARDAWEGSLMSAMILVAAALVSQAGGSKFQDGASIVRSRAAAPPRAYT